MAMHEGVVASCMRAASPSFLPWSLGIALCLAPRLGIAAPADSDKVELLALDHLSLLVAGEQLDARMVKHRRALGLDIWWGRAPDERFSGLERYVNVIIVKRPGRSQITGSFEDGRGMWRLEGSIDRSLRARLESPPKDRPACGHEDGAQLVSPLPPTEPAQQLGDGACGIIYVDMFMGFTDNAALETPDIDAEAVLLTEQANTGLFNSHVLDIEIRLIGTGTTPMDGGVTTSFLSMVDSVFGVEAWAIGADLIGIVATNQNGEDEAGGWAYVPGYVQVVLSGLTGAWRHELGHNAGASHCQPEGGGITAYAYGHSPGEGLSTHMCGNATNFYSTPWVENEGFVIGSQETADMARLWHERAVAMSEERVHVIDFPACEEDTTGPTVVITSPENPSEYLVPDAGSQQGVTIAAEASDDGFGVESVRLQINGEEVPGSEDILWPYAWPLNLPVGEFEVIAIAKDFAENEAMSDALTISVIDESVPAETSTSTSAGEESSGTGESSDTTDVGGDDVGAEGEDTAGQSESGGSGCSCRAGTDSPIQSRTSLGLLALLALRRRRRS